MRKIKYILIVFILFATYTATYLLINTYSRPQTATNIGLNAKKESTLQIISTNLPSDAKQIFGIHKHNIIFYTTTTNLIRALIINNTNKTLTYPKVDSGNIPDNAVLQISANNDIIAIKDATAYVFSIYVHNEKIHFILQSKLKCNNQEKLQNVFWSRSNKRYGLICLNDNIKDAKSWVHVVYWYIKDKNDKWIKDNKTTTYLTNDYTPVAFKNNFILLATQYPLLPKTFAVFNTKNNKTSYLPDKYELLQTGLYALLTKTTDSKDHVRFTPSFANENTKIAFKIQEDKTNQLLILQNGYEQVKNQRGQKKELKQVTITHTRQETTIDEKSNQCFIGFDDIILQYYKNQWHLLHTANANSNRDFIQIFNSTLQGCNEFNIINYSNNSITILTTDNILIDIYKMDSVQK